MESNFWIYQPSGLLFIQEMSRLHKWESGFENTRSNSWTQKGEKLLFTCKREYYKAADGCLANLHATNTQKIVSGYVTKRTEIYHSSTLTAVQNSQFQTPQRRKNWNSRVLSLEDDGKEFRIRNSRHQKGVKTETTGFCLRRRRKGNKFCSSLWRDRTLFPHIKVSFCIPDSPER